MTAQEKVQEMETRNQEFKEATQKVADFLNKWGHPHMTIIITQGSAEMLEGECCCNFKCPD